MARRKARTPDARANQLINMAYDLAEQQMADGTISATVLANLVKMGSPKDRLEREKLEVENQHLRAKIEALESAKHIEELYTKAMREFRIYNGTSTDDD